MAKIESNLDVKATYFFMTRSPFYNTFSRANNEIIRQIIGMGHAVGLHYDEGYDPMGGGSGNLQSLIDKEVSMLEQNFNIRIEAVSFHQPSDRILNNEVTIGQINTYDRDYFYDVKYISDSNMSFKEDPIELFSGQKHNKIQLLIHPIWWMSDGEEAEQKFINAIKHNFLIEQEQIYSTERAYGKRKDIEIK